jgi:hypothetical protein
VIPVLLGAYLAIGFLFGLAATVECIQTTHRGLPRLSWWVWWRDRIVCALAFIPTSMIIWPALVFTRGSK